MNKEVLKEKLIECRFMADSCCNLVLSRLI